MIKEDQNMDDLEYFTRVFHWNDMKPILISMKGFYCYDSQQIILNGVWTSDSVQKAYRNINRNINLEKAWNELINISISLGEGSIFDDEKFKKKFPNLEETDDTEYVRNVIKYVKRMRNL